MKNFFSKLFSDDNSINEKSVIGFIAFTVMIVFAAADIITGYLGKDLVVNEFIFNAFMILTLGAFGIASVDKWINKSNTKSNQPEETNEEEMN
jgi:ABC-type uncharacterized transport system permease subunit